MRYKDVVSAACELKKQGKFNKAIKLLEEGFKKYNRNTYIINGLIELYEPYRFDQAKGLFNKAVNMGVADTISYSLMIKHYIKENDLFNVRYLYGKSEMFNKSDNFTRADVLNFYLKNDYLIEAKQLYNELNKKNKVDIVVHNIWLHHLYKEKRYSEGLDIIKTIPGEKRDVALSITEIEINRKLKNYDYSLDLISNLFMKEKFDEEKEILLRTIRGYCLKDKGEIEKAGTIFRNIFKRINEESSNYIRVLCGMIFCYNVKENEVEMFSNILMKAQKEKKGNEHEVSEALDLLNTKIYKKMKSNKIKIKRNNKLFN